MIVLAPSLTPLGPIQDLHWNGSRTYTISDRRVGHTYTVRFEQANFKAHSRKIVWVAAEVGRQRKGTVDYPVHEVRKPTDWNGRYSSIYPGFLWGGRARRFWESDGRTYREIKGKKAELSLSRCTELRQIRVVIDGRTIPIDRTLCWDLLNPNLTKNHVRATLSKDGRTLTVGMGGSDGAGSYFAQWRFRKGGHHSRMMLDPEDVFSHWR